MLRGEALQGREALRRRSQPHDAMVGWVAHPSNQAQVFGAVDQPHDAVMAKLEIVGDVADRRTFGVAVPAEGQEQLMV